MVHSAVGELSDSTNQAVILPLYALCWPLGAIIGPMLGGTFSNAADKFPLLDVPLLRQYPYAMPCLVSAGFSIFGATLAYFLMEEVRRFSPLVFCGVSNSRTHHNRLSHQRRYKRKSNSSKQSPTDRYPLPQLLFRYPLGSYSPFRSCGR